MSTTAPDAHQDEAKRIVRAYAQDHLDKSDPETTFDVFVVWFAKTLQNWKALVSTTLPDGKYYEVTHNGDKSETYLDVYVKVSNRAISYDPFASVGTESHGIVLTPEQAGHAADWHDWVVDQGGEVPDEERELAIRLRDTEQQR